MSSSTSSKPSGAGAGVASSSSNSGAQPEKSYFEIQRAALIEEIGMSLEHVLQNINKLNRSLEGVIAVGNEFSSVEALWSQFETVMGKNPDPELEEHKGEDGEEEDEEDEDEHAGEEHTQR